LAALLTRLVVLTALLAALPGLLGLLAWLLILLPALLATLAALLVLLATLILVVLVHGALLGFSSRQLQQHFCAPNVPPRDALAPIAECGRWDRLSLSQ